MPEKCVVILNLCITVECLIYRTTSGQIQLYAVQIHILFGGAISKVGPTISTHHRYSLTDSTELILTPVWYYAPLTHMTMHLAIVHVRHV